MRFWDASAIVPLLAAEEASAAMRALLDADPLMVVWWATRVDVASAVTRREHAGSISVTDTSRLFRTLDGLAATWIEVQPTAPIRPLARRLLRTHPLRAADALQLAAALAVNDDQPAAVPFVCLDARLAAAARQEGLDVIG